MIRYEVRAFGPAGDFAFAATLRASDDSGAIAKFAQLPQAADRMELYRGKRRVTMRAAEAPAVTPVVRGRFAALAEAVG